MTNKKVVLYVLEQLLNNEKPNYEDVGVDRFLFNQIAKDMQEICGLIVGVGFTKSGGNVSTVFWEGVRTTLSGDEYYEKNKTK